MDFYDIVNIFLFLEMTLKSSENGHIRVFKSPEFIGHNFNAVKYDLQGQPD